MLGDVVSLGFSNHKWKKADRFLGSCRKENTEVCGRLGNHDVMGRRKKGDRNFNKRFHENIRTGYVSVTDSVAIVMLNSNFSTLSETDKIKQDTWYQATLNALDTNEAIKAVIVTCHHAPYSNSKIVRSSTRYNRIL
jgi:Icc-related predicted phosphoesterase